MWSYSGGLHKAMLGTQIREIINAVSKIVSMHLLIPLSENMHCIASYYILLTLECELQPATSQNSVSSNMSKLQDSHILEGMSMRLFIFMDTLRIHKPQKSPKKEIPKLLPTGKLSGEKFTWLKLFLVLFWQPVFYNYTEIFHFR